MFDINTGVLTSCVAGYMYATH